MTRHCVLIISALNILKHNAPFLRNIKVKEKKELMALKIIITEIFQFSQWPNPSNE